MTLTLWAICCVGLKLWLSAKHPAAVVNCLSIPYSWGRPFPVCLSWPSLSLAASHPQAVIAVLQVMENCSSPGILKLCRSVGRVFEEKVVLLCAKCSFKQELLFETFYRHRWNSFCHLNSVYIQESPRLRLWTYCERLFCSSEKHTSSSFESPCFYSLVYFSREMKPISPVMSREELFQKA